MAASLEYPPSIRLKMASAEAHVRGDEMAALELASAAREAEKHELEEFHARRCGRRVELER